MQRCLTLALLGAGHTAPNPMVGAILVHEGRIIGEGYHELYGKAHAEVNCLASVKEEDRHLIPQATIYVSLEPCAHHGKTPPCADLIIENKIERVVVGCRDPFPEVDGKGIEKLRAAGVEVTVGVLEKECIALNRRFFTFHTRHRPYILLKWAQSANGKIGAGVASAGKAAEAARNDSRIFISNAYSNRLVHKWRSEEAAILVGTKTALADDPALTVRLWQGPDPIRLVIDRELRLPDTLRLFDGTARTIVFNTVREGQKGNLLYYRLKGGGGSDLKGEGGIERESDLKEDIGIDRESDLKGEGKIWGRSDLKGEGGLERESDLKGEGGLERESDLKGEGGIEEKSNLKGEGGLKGKRSLVAQLVEALYELKILSVLVEGGASLLQSFIDEGYWDEARVITNNELEIPEGLAAPVLENVRAMAGMQGVTAGTHGAMTLGMQRPAVETLLSDTIRTYYRSELE